MALRKAGRHLGWVGDLAGAILDALSVAPAGPAIRSRPELFVPLVDPSRD